MLSASEREQLIDEKSLIAGRKFIINQNQEFVFIAPYLKDDSKTNMSHNFKEECRVLKIEPKLRPFLYKNENTFKKIKELVG